MLTFGPADCPRSIGTANPAERIVRNASRVPRQKEGRIQSSKWPHYSLQAREQDRLVPAGGRARQKEVCAIRAPQKKVSLTPYKSNIEDWAKCTMCVRTIFPIRPVVKYKAFSTRVPELDCRGRPQLAAWCLRQAKSE